MPDADAKSREGSEPEWVMGRPSKLPATLGRYVLERVLGEGGMGAVYLAHDVQLDRRVALKLPDLSNVDRPTIDRFLREARIAATLHHPNLCPVYDAGAIDGHYFLTMPVIEGRPLSDYLGQPLPQSAAVKIARRIAKAMQAAHESGIVHRDLKPSNIMLPASDHLMIMDFGLAQRSEAMDQKPLTKENHIVGTPAYMAPEQVRGQVEQIGPATDIYALGVILYQMLTGRTPFQGSFTGLVFQIGLEPPPPPRQFNPAIEPALEEVILIALAKKPEERYASMRAFSNALSYFRSGQPTDLASLPAGLAANAIDNSDSMAGPAAVMVPKDQDVVENAVVEVVERSRAARESSAEFRLPASKRSRRPQPRRRRNDDMEWVTGFLIKVGAGVLVASILWFGGRFLWFVIEMQNVKSALGTLKENPTESRALQKVTAFADSDNRSGWQVHRDAGWFLCTVAGDWPRGLRMLERAEASGEAVPADAPIDSAPALAQLARRDLADPQSAAEILAVADGWYELGQKESGTVKEKLQARARVWYQKIAGRVGGADLERVQSRLAAIPPPQ